MPDTKDIRALTPKNLSDQPAAVPGAPHDLLDRNPLRLQCENGGVGLLATHVSLVLQFLGKDQKRRIDHCGSHSRPDLPHGLSNSVENGAARVLHQMPAVSNLNRMWERTPRRDRIAPATIPSDDANLRMLRQLGLSRGRFLIQQ